MWRTSSTGSLQAAPFGGATYGYDAWGNLASHTNTAGAGYTYSFTMTPQNQVSQSGSTDSAFTYDISGDVLADGLNNYGYDAEGRLAAMNGSIAYLYGPEGERVATVQGGTIMAEYLYGIDGTLTTTVAPGGKLVRGLMYGAGVHLADYTQDGNTVFHLSDEVGSLVTTIDQTGAAVSGCSDNPFGESLNCSPSVDYTENHFADKKRDQESSLDYFGARYYASTFGRFMSPDPQGPTPLHMLNPQRWNMYGYGLNNPLSFTDSGGKDAAAVNFSKEIAIVGHEGIASVHSDGTVKYARFGPVGGGRLRGAGQVQSFTLNSKVQFDSSGQPTVDSLNAVKKELSSSNASPEQGQNPSSIRLNYFKTTKEETDNLDQWINQQQEASDRGKSPTYNFLTNNCAIFCQRGLVVGGAITQSQAENSVIVPNVFFGLLNQEPKATVTSSECDTLPDGNQRCQ